MDHMFLAFVTGVSVAVGMAAGGFVAHRTHKRIATKVINTVVNQSVHATSVIGSYCCDLLVEHEKLSPRAAMEKLVETLKSRGLAVMAYKVRGSDHVHTTE